MNSSKTTTVAAGTAPRIGRWPRRLATLATAPLVAAAALASSTGTASATVGPYVQERVSWGDCVVVLGTVPDAYYRAYAGTDVYCGHRRTSITIKVDLWKWDGSRWTMVATSGQRTVSNTTQSSVVTGPYSVPGCAYWDITTTVYVDGSRLYRDYGQDQGSYPKWNPTKGNC
jgi:hypothetical protein